jgi:ferrous iron transport protein B
MEQRKVALIGNPNSGKTSLFNILTGLNQKVGNFAGVTVERKAATLHLDKKKPITLIDLPGTNSLYPSSEDEAVACEILRDHHHEDHPDLTLVVVDATQLKRGLLLASQLIDLGIPVAVVLNMIDLVEKSGNHISTPKLSQLLGVPVIQTSALKKQGLGDLKNLLKQDIPASPKRFLTIPPGFRPALDELKPLLETDQDYLAYQAFLLPEQFGRIPQEVGQRLHQEAGLEESQRLISNELLVRFDRLDNIEKNVTQKLSSPGLKFTNQVDKVLTHPIWGYAIFLGILFLVFQALFSWANYPMDAIDAGFSSLTDWLEAKLPAHWATDLLTNGILAGLGGIVIFVPQIAFLFFFISILEESGYMSRVVFLMDRIMRPFGLSGKSVIPLIGGMACAIPSIMMARSISSRKERLITILVTPLMSCAARIPVYVLLIALFVPEDTVLGLFNLQGIVMMGFYLLGFFAALAFAWIFKIVLKYTKPAVFVTELPIYRMPRWESVGMTIYQKSKTFVVEAGKVILIISIILWFLADYGPSSKMEAVEAKYEAQLADIQDNESLSDSLTQMYNAEKLQNSYAGHVGKFIEPVIKPLGFDWKIGISLLTSFAAREVFVGTMATIYSVEEDGEENVPLLDRLRNERDPKTGEPVYGTATAISLLVFFAFAMQCMSTLAITWKETGGWKWPLVMVSYLTALAYLASLIVYQVLA